MIPFTLLSNKRRSNVAPDVNLLNNLVSYWIMDETAGNNRVDIPGNNDLTDDTSTPRAAGKITFAADFEGSDYLHIDDDPDLISFSAMTLSFWVYFDATTDSGLIGKNRDFAYEYWVRFAFGQFEFRIIDTNEALLQATTTGLSISTGTWYHIAAWFNNSSINIQINNGTTFTTTGTHGNVISLGYPLHFGHNNNHPFFVTEDLLNGRMCEVGLWGRALNADERAALYNGGNGLAYPF